MNGKYWAKEECYRAVEDYILKIGKLPMAKDMRGKNRLPPYKCLDFIIRNHPYSFAELMSGTTAKSWRFSARQRTSSGVSGQTVSKTVRKSSSA